MQDVPLHGGTLKPFAQSFGQFNPDFLGEDIPAGQN